MHFLKLLLFYSVAKNEKVKLIKIMKINKNKIVQSFKQSKNLLFSCTIK